VVDDDARSKLLKLGLRKIVEEVLKQAGLRGLQLIVSSKAFEAVLLTDAVDLSHF